MHLDITTPFGVPITREAFDGGNETYAEGESTTHVLIAAPEVGTYRIDVVPDAAAGANDRFTLVALEGNQARR